MVALGDVVQAAPDNLVLIEGGIFKNTKSSYSGQNLVLPDFYIGKYEVTQKEWTEVMGGNPSQFPGDNLPVEMVSWYDCIDYCNKRSLQEGLRPCYAIDREKKDPHNRTVVDDVKWTITINAGRQWLSSADGSGVGICRRRRPAEQELRLQRQRRHRQSGLVLGQRGGQAVDRIVVLAGDRTKSHQNQTRRRQGTQRAGALRYVGQRPGMVLGLVRGFGE
ncbi:MAG: SUMF1/EgtB/PvdO family nonheme iron enzyme [Lacunisphaera sp.]